MNPEITSYFFSNDKEHQNFEILVQDTELQAQSSC